MNSYVRKAILVILDIIIVIFSFLVAYLLRFESLDQYYFNQFKDLVVYFVLIYIFTNYIFGIYKKIWRYAGLNELFALIISTGFAGLISYFFFWEFSPIVPRSVLVLTFVLSFMFIGGSRFLYRLILSNRLKKRNYINKKRLLIVGAGNACAMLLKEIFNDVNSQYLPVAIVDDSKWKYNNQMFNVTVKGNISKIPFLVEDENIDEIIIAIPSASKSRIREIIEIAGETNAVVKTLPNINELISGNSTLKQARNIDVVDLLGRDEVKLDISNISLFLKDKIVLITGGGGSIGSELCRQIIKYDPKKIILLDNYENNLYELELEIKQLNPKISYEVIIANIREKDNLNRLFKLYKPNIVFHAAAHKHVPLMENNPSEALKNNIFGTLNLSQVSIENNVEKFILISTDKAVNPTNIMGATKRIAELIIQNIGRNTKTEFAAVRFGNVLGSNGSVIPIFKKQIRKGGPITITHPEITRYFMTIPEAAILVIQAGAIAKGGEIFVLDMGEPVKILDLATKLIELSGFVPYKDIDIEFIGLRPGEKLFEELMLEEEGLRSTFQEGILITTPQKIDSSEFFVTLEELKLNIYDTYTVRRILNKYVPSVNVNE